MKPSRLAVAALAFAGGIFAANGAMLASRYLALDAPRSPYLEPISARGSVLRAKATAAFIAASPRGRRAAVVELNARWRAARPDCWSTEVVVEDAAGRYLGSLLSTPEYFKLDL